MGNLAGHLFVLGIALLVVPITAFLGPVVTSLLGLLCLVMAVGVYRYTDSPPPGLEGAGRSEQTNCHSCGSRVTDEDSCEYCGTDLSTGQ